MIRQESPNFESNTGVKVSKCWHFLNCNAWAPNSLSNTDWIEIPEIISSEHSCFRDLTFSALIQRPWKEAALIGVVSELTSFTFFWIRTTQNWRIQLWTALFQRESTLNQCCSALIWFSSETLSFQRWTARNQL